MSRNAPIMRKSVAIQPKFLKVLKTFRNYFNKRITIPFRRTQNHGSTNSQRDPARNAGEDRGKTQPVHRPIDRGGGDAPPDQQSHPSARHQGPVGKWQGGPGAGDHQVMTNPIGFQNL
jgi:hypothetical protein